MSVTFLVKGSEFVFPLDKIPQNSYLWGLIFSPVAEKNRINGKIHVTEVSFSLFKIIWDYLVNEKLPPFNAKQGFEALGIPLDEWTQIIMEEDFMRNMMYQPLTEDDRLRFEKMPEEDPDYELLKARIKMVDDPYYNLIKIDKDTWENLKLELPEDPNLLFVRDKEMSTPFWELDNDNDNYDSEDELMQFWNNRADHWNNIENMINLELDKKSNQDITFIINKLKYKTEKLEVKITDCKNNKAKDKFTDLFENNYLKYLVLKKEKINKSINKLIKMQQNNRLSKVDEAIEILRKAGRIKKEVVLEKDDFDLIFNRVSNYYIDQILKVEGVMIAGGSIFGSLFNKDFHDVDIFLIGKDEEKAIKKIFQIVSKVLSPLNLNLKILRSGNVINIKDVERYEKDFQIILRLYHSYSELLHGFDVDSCCMGFDGKDIWMTKRCWYSIKKGFNTVNFDRLSPSYSYRLAKYGTRGIAVKVPKFNRDFVNQDALENRLTQYFEKRIKNQGKPNNLIKDQHGLDILLFSEYRWRELKQHGQVGFGFDNISKIKSDYDSNSNANLDIKYLIKFLLKGLHKYPGNINFLTKIYEQEELFDKNPLLTNSFICSKNRPIYTFALRSDKIDNIKAMSIIMDIPEEIYNIYTMMREVKLPRKVEFKVTNPGEQMTNTFNKLVLEDNKEWYKGEFYDWRAAFN